MRGRFWCKFRFWCGQNLWVMGVYGILEVWVKRGSTVVPGCVICLFSLVLVSISRNEWDMAKIITHAHSVTSSLLSRNGILNIPHQTPMCILRKCTTSFIGLDRTLWNS
jgi:hypothetical protein